MGRVLAVLLVLLSGLFAGQGGAEPPFIRSCSKMPYGPLRASVLQPLGIGPLHARGHYCLLGPGDELNSVESAALSPDGTAVLVGGHQGLIFRQLNRTAPPALSDAAAGGPWRWSQDGRFAWAALPAAQKPESRFASLHLARLWRDGRLEALPPFDAALGELNQMLWTPDGRGLAVFNAPHWRGPPAGGLPPMLALVDGRTGKVLQSALLTAITPRPQDWRINESFAVTTLPDGRLRAILRSRTGWFWWTEGEALKPLALPGDVQGEPLPLPDGKRMLFVHHLSAYGAICEYAGPGPAPDFCGPHPVTGPWVSLYEMEPGKVLWRLTETAETFGQWVPPALSADGRLAAAAAPMRRDRTFRLAPFPIRLIDVEAGRVLQTVNAPILPRDMGFARDGRLLWIKPFDAITLYEVDR